MQRLQSSEHAATNPARWKFILLWSQINSLIVEALNMTCIGCMTEEEHIGDNLVIEKDEDISTAQSIHIIMARCIKECTTTLLFNWAWLVPGCDHGS